MKKILNSIKSKAVKDTQINTSSIFEKFTDFQNIMLSDLSLLDLLWEGEEEKLKNITIGELYEKNLNSSIIFDYENIVFSGNDMLEMTIKKNWKIYRPLVLGKLIRYGFFDIKIKEKISGNNGFDAFILEDKIGDIMIYFPCTNLIELEDYLYDSYPIMISLIEKNKIIGNIANNKKIFNSQQSQAKELLYKYLTKNTKIHISGFSLGGSLAEYAYLNWYKSYSNKLGNLILFNPYHNRLNSQEISILKNSKKLKLYVCEGDLVSTVFNYEDFKDIAQTVYINYQNNFSDTIDDINKNNSLLNLVANRIKNKYCDNIIEICKKIKKNPILNISLYFLLKFSIKRLKKLKKEKIDVLNHIKQIKPIIDKISPKLKKHGYDLENDYNLDFLENLHYIEVIFTSTHLTYTVDFYKLISFDKNGKIKKKLRINNKMYEVKYPSFDETSKKIFLSNPYSELSHIIANLKK